MLRVVRSRRLCFYLRRLYWYPYCLHLTSCLRWPSYFSYASANTQTINRYAAGYTHEGAPQRSDVPEDEDVPTSNYDVASSITSRQPLPESLSLSLPLDYNVACDPSIFSIQWNRLGPGTEVAYKTNKSPTIEECHHICETHRFYPVASGIVDRFVMKLFLIARCGNLQCLCELKFEPMQMCLKLHMKLNPDATAASLSSSARAFIEKLPLGELFGASEIFTDERKPLKLSMRHT